VIAWLEIDTDPPLAFYRETIARGMITSADARHPLLTDIGALRRPMSVPGVSPAESPNLSVSLDNGSGQIAALFRHNPPVRVVARINSDLGELFAGVVTDISLGSSASISIEAGFVRPMSDRLPIRSTTEWGDYSNVRAIPLPYGRVTLTPIQYDAGRTQFVVSDGAIAGVDQVTIDGSITAGWDFRNTVDLGGKVVGMLTFIQPVEASADIAVSLRGRVHPVTGALMETPDQIIWDLLTNVCGLGINPAALDAFRSEVVGLAIGGVVNDPTRTIRAQVDQIIASIGGAWSVAADGIASIWPFVDDALVPTRAKCDRLTMVDLSSRASHDAMINVIRINYDYDWSAGEHKKTVQIEDAESIKRYGRLEKEWDAGWLHLERQARALGDRLIESLAVPRWTLTWEDDAIGVLPGDWIEITNQASPIAGRQRVLAADLDLSRLVTTITVEAAPGIEQVIYPPVPPDPTETYYRLTEAGDIRITETGDNRITE